MTMVAKRAPASGGGGGEQVTAPALVAAPDAPALFDLLIVNLEPVEADGEQGKTVPAYRVTLEAMWPEIITPTLLAFARAHRLKVSLHAAHDVPR